MKNPTTVEVKATLRLTLDKENAKQITLSALDLLAAQTGFPYQVSDIEINSITTAKKSIKKISI